VESVGDVLIELAPRLRPFEASEPRPEGLASVPVELDSKQRKLLDLLGFEPVASDELAARAGLTAAELSSMLLLLEMNGVVEALPVARYCRLVKRS
jgi:DNA processing protein